MKPSTPMSSWPPTMALIRSVPDLNSISSESSPAFL
ncbi:Uncharacterised protein [Bordetella pertussis]|nr:Uncharacterised protein [Bordetella pertussis]